MMTQAIALARKPHIVIGTPGRIVDHLENTKGFSLRSVRYLVLDEADRMLSLDFEEAINTILASLPRERHTYLFSATMTSKVAKLQRASLVSPVRVEVSDKYDTVSTLVQQYLFIPSRFKEAYLVYTLNEFAGQSAIVFASTCATAQRTALMLKHLGFSATSLHGQMSQSKRLGSLAKFKSGSRTVLVATDVAARGLDIPSVRCPCAQRLRFCIAHTQPPCYRLTSFSTLTCHPMAKTTSTGLAGLHVVRMSALALMKWHFSC